MRLLLLMLFSIVFAEAAFAQPAVDPALLEWRTRLTAAKSHEGEAQRRDALLVLMREALSKYDVRLSGSKHADEVHPEDNQPAPIINFDVRLNLKTSARGRSGAAPRSLQGNFGYYFSTGGNGYVVLGPAALDPRSPVFTRLAAEHEMFHAEHHVGDRRSLDERELETWTTMFVRYFHEVHQFRQQWAPMLAYYERATAGERQRAIERLATYYRSPPAGFEDEAGASTLRAAFRQWLARRQKGAAASQFVRDLERALGGPPAPVQRRQ